MADEQKPLTDADLAPLQALLKAHDRGGFYVRYWTLTGSREALLQAHIATFSGFAGGQALGINMELQNRLKKAYEGIFFISQEVAEGFYGAVKASVHPEKDGAEEGVPGRIGDMEGMDRARQTWQELRLEQYFPGNMLYAVMHGAKGEWDKLAEIFTPGTEYALAGTFWQYGWRYGKRASDFADRPGYKTVPVEGPNGAVVDTVQDKDGYTVFVGEPHGGGAGAGPLAGNPAAHPFERLLPDLEHPYLPAFDPASAVAGPLERMALERLSGVLERPFRAEADEKHAPFDRAHPLWRPLPPGIADRDRMSESPDLSSDLLPWLDRLMPSLGGKGAVLDYEPHPAPAPSLEETPDAAPARESAPQRHGFWRGPSLPQLAASATPADSPPLRRIALGPQTTFAPEGGQERDAAAPLDDGWTAPQDGARPDETAESGARIEALLAALGEKVGGIDRSRPRLRKQEVIDIVREWMRREANKPCHSSFRYDLDMTYTPPGVIPPM